MHAIRNELRPQRKTHGSARTKEEYGGGGGEPGRIECDYSLIAIPVLLPAK